MTFETLADLLEATGTQTEAEALLNVAQCVVSDTTCGQCGGTGTVDSATPGIWGYPYQVDCPDCNGTGKHLVATTTHQAATDDSATGADHQAASA